MEVKGRSPSKELQVFNSLSSRFNLLEKDKQYHSSLKKGFEGELLFDKYIDHLHCEYLVIKDLLLTFKNTTFQIDTLLIVANIIKLFEVKNFEGNYYYKDDKLTKLPDYEVTNPLYQLNRAETLLRQLIKSLGFTIQVEGNVVFINPEFTLYQAPVNKPFILPTQINSLTRDLNTYHSTITNRHNLLADKLVSLHQEDSPYQKIPTYEYEQLKRGITCHHCNALSLYVKGHYCYCNICEKREKVEHAIIRSTSEFKILFPNERITTEKIHDWCGKCLSSKQFKRILQKHYKHISNNRWSYFE